MDIWLYIGGVFVGLVFGAGVTFLVYTLITRIIDNIKIKRKLKTKNPEIISAYIDKNRDHFKFPEKELPTKQEEKPNGRRVDKFREFEKLRRIERNQRGTEKERRKHLTFEGDAELPGSKLFPYKPDQQPQRSHSESGRTSKKLKLDY